MKKSVAILTLEAHIEKVNNELSLEKKRVAVLERKNKELQEKYETLKNSLGTEVMALRKQTKVVRELKETLQDITLSATDNPTVFTGLAYVVKVINELRSDLMRKGAI